MEKVCISSSLTFVIQYSFCRLLCVYRWEKSGVWFDFSHFFLLFCSFVLSDGEGNHQRKANVEILVNLAIHRTHAHRTSKQIDRNNVIGILFLFSFRFDSSWFFFSMPSAITFFCSNFCFFFFFPFDFVMW